jgi:putative FmdB family regulatory protein
MPTYTKHCQECDEIFDVLCKIADKDIPKECPHCGSMDSVYMIGAPTLSRHSERLMTHKKDGGFGEVLDKIKSKNPRSALASGRNSASHDYNTFTGD